MNNLQTINQISEISTIIVILSAVLFCANILPAFYGSASLFLAGVAGQPTNTISEGQPTELALVNTSLAYASGIVGALSVMVTAMMGVRKSQLEARAEEMKLKSIQLQYDMQMREVEILKLELEKEKMQKKVKK